MAGDLSFFTGVRFTKEMLRAVTSITFMYDPNWNIQNMDVTTLPVSFFQVAGMHEIMNSKVNTKELMFYSDSLIQNKPQASSGLLNVVADNIVIEPKQYSLDLIIPSTGVSVMSSNFGYGTLKNGSRAVFDWLSVNDDAGKTFGSIINGVNTSFAVLDEVLSVALKLNYASAGKLAESIMNTPRYNVDSLEAMWRSRSILKLKTWEGWKYKYVSIVNLDINKEPDEDNNYRGKLVVQEIPIMTVPTGFSVPKVNVGNVIAQVTGKALTWSLDRLGV